MLVRRIASFIRQARWLTKLTRNPIYSAQVLVKARGNRTAVFQGRYQTHSFAFRSLDASALKEVLVDQEYNFLTDMIAGQADFKILDLGGHIGTFGLWALATNPDLDLMSVEADPQTFRILATNAERANVRLVTQGKGRWRVANFAAWQADEPVSFSDHGDSMSHRVERQGQLTVQGMSLASMVEAFRAERINLMKIDIEGSEEKFLTAHPEALATVDRVLIEVHPNLCDDQAVIRLLQSRYGQMKEVEGRISSKPLLLFSH